VKQANGTFPQSSFLDLQSPYLTPFLTHLSSISAIQTSFSSWPPPQPFSFQDSSSQGKLFINLVQPQFLRVGSQGCSYTQRSSQQHPESLFCNKISGMSRPISAPVPVNPSLAFFSPEQSVCPLLSCFFFLIIPKLCTHTDGSQVWEPPHCFFLCVECVGNSEVARYHIWYYGERHHTVFMTSVKKC